MYNNFSSKKTKKVISALLASALVVTSAPISAEAATTKVLGVNKTFTKTATKVSGLSKSEKKIVKVTVNKSKKKVTVKGLKPGKASFKIGSKSYTVKVGAVKIKAKSFKTSLTVGTNKTVTVTSSYGAKDKLAWSSSNKKVVKVKTATTTASSKKVGTNKLIPVAAGKATITVKSKNTGKSLKVKVTVKAKTTPTTAPTATATGGAVTTPSVAPTATTTATKTPEATTAAAVTATPEVPSGSATKAPTATPDAATGSATKAPEATTTAAATATPSAIPTVEPTKTPEVVTGGTITVTTNVTGVAIKVSTGSTVVATTTTTTSSGAVLANIPVGTYEVEVSADGYVTKTEIVTVDGDETVSFKLVEKATVSSVVAVDNKKLYVEGKNLDQIKAENVKVGAKTATELSDVDSVELRKDGSLFIVTKGMTAGTAYTVQIAGQTFTAIAKPADSDALTVNTVTAKSSTLVEVAFNEDDADKLTLLDKDNYVFDNGLKATDVTYKYDANGDKVLGTVYVSTTAQTAGQVYTLTINGVSDLAGNVIEKDTKKTFAGIAEDKTAPTLVSVGSDKGNKVTVIFNDDSMMDAGSLSNVANYTISGLEVKKATVKTNELTGGNAEVELETSEQTIGKVYTLVINNVKDIYGNTPTKALEQTFAGTAIDKDAPKISTVTAETNTTVSVVFDDVMDEETATNVANYAIDGGLNVVSAKLNTDKKDTDNYLKEVVLTTTAQTVGAVYELTVSNVKDAAGNVISNTTSTDYKKTFAGVGVDTTAPTVSVYTAGTPAKNKVTLQFSEAVDEKTAKEPTNYKIEGLGYPTAVSFDETNNRVTLTTAAQSNGAIYKITINNIADKAGNVIKKDTEVKFAGIGNVAEAAKISSATAINNRQIKVIFNKAVNLTPGNATTYFTLKDSAATPNSVVLASSNGLYKIDDKTYIITTATEKLENQIYTLTAVDNAIKDLGDVELSRADSDDYTKKVGGVTTDPSTPKVVAVTQRSAKTLEVKFDQEVSGSDATVKLDYEDDTTDLTNGNLVIDTTDKTKGVVTFSSAITGNKVAKLCLTLGGTCVKDITGNFGIAKVASTDTSHDFKFGTTNYTASTVKVSGATGIDEQTVEVTFNQAVDTTGMDAGTFAIKDKDGSAAVAGLTIKSVKQTAPNKVRIYFSTTKALTSGTLYSVVVDDNAEIKDLDGTAMSNVAADKSATFGANNTKNEAPKLISAIPLSKSTIQFAFDKAVVNGTTESNFILKNKTTGAVVTNTNYDIAQIDEDGAVYTLKLTDGYFALNNKYSLEVNSSNNITSVDLVDDVQVSDESGDTIVADFGGVEALAAATLSNNTATGFTATFDTQLYSISSGTLTALTSTVCTSSFDKTGTVSITSVTPGQSAGSGAYDKLTFVFENAVNEDTIIAATTNGGIYDGAGNLLTPTYTYNATATKWQ